MMRNAGYGCRMLMLGGFFLSVLAGCQATKSSVLERAFGEDVAFLKKHTDVVVLGQGEAQIAVVPAYQGRVMTSTAAGEKGRSYGWLNYRLIKQGVLSPEQEKGKAEAHIYVFGGEDRFWMGPEGGQYAIFFAPGSKFVFEDWFTPAVIDTEPFDLISRSADSAMFGRQFELTNYSGTKFKVAVKRQVRLLDRRQAMDILGTSLSDSLRLVAFETDNKMTNSGSNAWTKEGGLLSIWILGMFKHSPTTTVVVPIKQGPEDTLGIKVNDVYFGKVPADRIKAEDDVVFFSGDGQCRSKIGVSPRRAKGVMASYDAANRVLTIVTYTQPQTYVGYINSLWQWQDKPYDGDVIMSYNDGPVKPGEPPLGPFYELESSSPAAALAPEETIEHVQRTIHLEGSESELDQVARKILGVGLDRIKTALSPVVTGR